MGQNRLPEPPDGCLLHPSACRLLQAGRDWQRHFLGNLGNLGCTAGCSLTCTTPKNRAGDTPASHSCAHPAACQTGIPQLCQLSQPVTLASHRCANLAASLRPPSSEEEHSPQRPTQGTALPASCAAPALSGAAPPSHAPQCPPWNRGHASGCHTCPQSQTPAVWSGAAWSPAAACGSTPPPCSARCRGTQRGEALLVLVGQPAARSSSLSRRHGALLTWSCLQVSPPSRTRA